MYDFQTLYNLYDYYSRKASMLYSCYYDEDEIYYDAELLAKYYLREICKIYDLPLDKSGKP